jgi:hypothetical protein
VSEENNQFDLHQMVNEAFGEKMITNYIIIAETVSTNERSLQIATSDGMTTWLASGMLNCASDIVLNQNYEIDLDEDEEDDD